MADLEEYPILIMNKWLIRSGMHTTILFKCMFRKVEEEGAETISTESEFHCDTT